MTMSTPNRMYCPRCGTACQSSDKYCGVCGLPLAAVASHLRAVARAEAAPAPPGRAAPGAARPARWMGLWTRPATGREWGLFLLQVLPLIGFLAVAAACLGEWAKNSTVSDTLFKLLSLILGFLAALVLVGIAVLPGAWRRRNWQYGAAGCLALPALGVVLLAGAFILVVWLGTNSSAQIQFAPFLACLGGLLPLGALVYVLSLR